MRIVVTGASGNVGTSLVRALATDDRVLEIIGLARRRPAWTVDKLAWVQGDVVDAPLEKLFAGADAVVHLAWLIQPSRDEGVTHRVNVEGSRRVFEAAAAAGAGALVYASSVGAYSPGPKDPGGVDESWPTGGIETSFYSRHKAAVERELDRVERECPRMRVVRLRPGLIFKGEAGTEVRRLFAGPFLPSPLVRPRFLRVVPRIRRLVFQGVHTEDVAEAYRLAALEPGARGAYNVAAGPVIDPGVLAEELGAVQIPLRAGAVRALADLTWRLRLQPTPPGWLDMALGVPVMSSDRIRDELGWAPRHSSLDALRELLEGMADGRGLDTPPLQPRGRGEELSSGVGARNPG